MKELLKSIFNLNTILSSYIGAIGYGVGYNLPNKMNLHPFFCIVCCLILGMLFDRIAKKILSSKYFLESKKNKVITTICVYAGYLIAWLIVHLTLDYDLDYDFLISIYIIIGFQILILIINFIKKYFFNKKFK